MKYNFKLLYAIIILCAYLTGLSPAQSQISTPLDIAGTVFWVDGKDINGTGVQPANGAVITSWADKSGGGNNLTTQAGTVTFEAAGFDGINPGLRFPLTARMSAGNPFAANFQNAMTVFVVNANVTLTNNFSISLNGTNTGNNIADGRFSLHSPWVDNRIYFDAGACCGATRLSGTYPNAITETTLTTALNDAPGGAQALRIDGQTIDSDTTGHNANVSRGIHIGDLPDFHRYNGRFAEVLIYDRALSGAEIADVECFLLLKWKLAAAPPGCVVDISAVKSVTSVDAGAYSLPGSDVIYTIEATHISGPSLDAETVFLADKLPDEVTFFNGDIDGAGPETSAVSLSDSGSGLALDYANDVGFSNAAAAPTSLADCTYSPAAGYDPNVTYICIQPSGIFRAATPDTSFSVSFRARIK